MKTKDFIDSFKIAIAEVKGANRKTIRVSALEEFLTTLEAENSENDDISEESLNANIDLFKAKNEINLTKYKVEHERSLTQYETESASQLEVFKSVISTGQNALKCSLIINGGASLALLTFIGNYLTKSNSPSLIISMLAFPLYIFTLGVFSAALSSGFTYFVQYSYYEDWSKRARTSQVSAILLATISFIMFGIGVFKTYKVLINF